MSPCWDPTPTRTDYRYRHFDHLGSVTAESDERGHVATAAWAGSSAGIFGYDAWGARRSPDGRAADSAGFSPPTGHRGFTDQEDIEGLGLVNMNGRIYDPVVGRFLSADPHVQFASNLQSYNRYSYAAGNPLKYTDPTGYYNYWKEGGLGSFVNFTLGIASLAVCAGTGGAGCAVAFAIASVAINTTAAIASGDSWNSVLATSAVGLGAGLLFGQIGSGIGGAVAGVDNPGLAAAVGGFISGGAAVAVMTPLTGGDLGDNIMIGAIHGALGASLGAALAQDKAVSQAAAEMQERTMAAPQAAAAGAPTAAEAENEFLKNIDSSIAPPQPGPTFDAGTEYAIGTLRPDLQGLARQHIFTLKQAAVDARVVQGSRSYTTQARLYAQGRTTGGSIVTNAAAGSSAHNYGAAYDIGVFGPTGYEGGGDAYTVLGPAAAPAGVSWGNNIAGFPKGDLGHYELPSWRSLPNLQIFR